jgi:hypothetical protein
MVGRGERAWLTDRPTKRAERHREPGHVGCAARSAANRTVAVRLVERRRICHISNESAKATTFQHDPEDIRSRNVRPASQGRTQTQGTEELFATSPVKARTLRSCVVQR